MDRSGSQVRRVETAENGYVVCAYSSALPAFAPAGESPGSGGGAERLTLEAQQGLVAARRLEPLFLGYG